MQAIRETLDVIGSSVTIHLPSGFAARRVEVIVLPAVEQESPAVPTHPHRHQPAAELAGTVVHDDLIAPADSDQGLLPDGIRAPATPLALPLQVIGKAAG